MKRTFGIAAVVALLVAGQLQRACAQTPHPWSTVIRIGGVKVAQYGGKLLRSVISNPQKVRWFFGGRHHTWWASVYTVGFRVHNNFRSYRGTDQTAPYFLATADGGASDARTHIEQH